MENTPFIDPIDPLSHITDHRPKTETAAQVKDWFEIERMELNFGDEQGRPSKDIQARRETLDRLFADGWYVTEVKESAESGEWKRVTTVTQKGSESQESTSSSSGSSDSTSSSSGTTQTQGQSQSQSTNENDSESIANSKSHSSSTAGYNSWMGRNSTTTDGTGSSSNSGHASATTDSTGSTTNTGMETSTGSAKDSFQDTENASVEKKSDTESTTEEEGATYWAAYALIRLERKRMQADKVLQTMVSQLVDSYNQGKQINLDRYDEIVALYALMLQRTEAEGNKLIEDGIDFIPLFDDLKAMVIAALEKVSASQAEDWKASRIAEINRKFDAIVGQVAAKLVTEGRYNTTVYTSEVAGTERERQYALNNVKEEILNVELRVAEMTSNVGNNLINAQTRIFEALQKKRIDPINLRNTVFKYMLDFMERREDPYQELAEMPTIAERLGYSGGIAYPGSSTPTEV